MEPALLERIDRLESQLSIQQLPARYAVALDARDIQAWLNLFVDDVDCGRHGKGREVLRQFIEPAVRNFYRSHHQICGHVIDFIDADHASGTVYCRAEHEHEEHWIVMAICYFDQYERRDGSWYFTARDEQHWYTTDILERPFGPNAERWDAWAKSKPKLPGRFSTWKPFWDKGDPQQVTQLSRLP
ncbi:nuclear transport factor 2 family protein [Pseudomonas sp. BF-R-19]|uniref:nuclear transport factor 2 family protein n=1 Tax=Pseudomonas sp. BF-R-19 TaxID=2832397 RepID=UPI001CC0D0FE|nr:nuclear transport factor 2 family protein [Pseudomonas sp. BF-R-19]